MIFINLTNIPIPRPIIIKIRIIVMIGIKIPFKFISGSTLKSKGNSERSVETDAIPNIFITILVMLLT